MGIIRVLKPEEQLEKRVESHKNPYLAVDENGNTLDFIDFEKVYPSRGYSSEVYARMVEKEKWKAIAKIPDIFKEYHESLRIARMERKAQKAANEMMERMLKDPNLNPKYNP